jgi:hypothetical protein
MKRLTKKQRSAKARASGAIQRKARAARAMLKAMNPSRKYAGFKIRKNPGGSVTVIPVKILKAIRGRKR